MSIPETAAAPPPSAPDTTPPRPPVRAKLPTPSHALTPVALTIADSIVNLTNRERVRAKLPRLVKSVALTRAAQIHAEQMAAADRLAHDLPSARHPTLAARLKVTGYTARAAAENIAEGYTSAAAALAGWMNSAGHRQNILSPRYSEIGVGTARSRRGRAFHAQVFGRRLTGPGSVTPAAGRPATARAAGDPAARAPRSAPGARRPR